MKSSTLTLMLTLFTHNSFSSSATEECACVPYFNCKEPITAVQAIQCEDSIEVCCDLSQIGNVDVYGQDLFEMHQEITNNNNCSCVPYFQCRIHAKLRSHHGECPEFWDVCCNTADVIKENR